MSEFESPPCNVCAGKAIRMDRPLYLCAKHYTSTTIPSLASTDKTQGPDERTNRS